MELYKVKCCATCKWCEVAYTKYGGQMYLCRKLVDSINMKVITCEVAPFTCCDAWQPGYEGEYR